jgi:hypothetical protein
MASDVLIFGFAKDGRGKRLTPAAVVIVDEIQLRRDNNGFSSEDDTKREDFDSFV